MAKGRIMMRQWVTVVDWQQGVATVNCAKNSGCEGCQHKNGCGNGLLNRLAGPKTYSLQIKSEQPLLPGQRVEIGLSEANLLRSALVVYTLPLLAGILGALFFQLWSTKDLVIFGGALLGGLLGFVCARYYAHRLQSDQTGFAQILQIEALAEKFPLCGDGGK